MTKNGANPVLRPATVLGRQLRIPNLYVAHGASDLEAVVTALAGLDSPGAATLAVPTKHGGTLIALHESLVKAKAEGRLERPPRLLAASTKTGNPIVWSLARHDETCKDLQETEVWPSEISKALATEHADKGDGAMKAVRESQGWGFAASDAELQGLARQLERTEGLQASPAAMAGVAALHFAAKIGRLEPDMVHVALVATNERS